MTKEFYLQEGIDEENFHVKYVGRFITWYNRFHLRSNFCVFRKTMPRPRFLVCSFTNPHGIVLRLGIAFEYVAVSIWLNFGKCRYAYALARTKHAMFERKSEIVRTVEVGVVIFAASRSDCERCSWRIVCSKIQSDGFVHIIMEGCYVTINDISNNLGCIILYTRENNVILPDLKYSHG